MLLQNEIILKVNALCSVPGKVLQDFRGFSLDLDDMEGDLSLPPICTGGQSSNREDGWGGTYTLWWGNPYFE